MQAGEGSRQITRGALSLSSWNLYFPEVPCSADRCFLLASSLAEFLSSSNGRRLLKVHKGRESLVWKLSYRQLESAHGLPDEVAEAIENCPEEALKCLAVAAAEVLQLHTRETEFGVSTKIEIQLHEFSASTCSLKELRAEHLGELVTVHGTVVRVTGVKPLVTSMNFTCDCGATTPMEFPDGRLTLPSACSNGDCRSKKFEQQRESAQKVSFQRLRLQESRAELGDSGPSDTEGGRGVPRTVDVELTRDLVDCCCPGDVITVCGLLKVMNQDVAAAGASGRGKRREQCVFQLFLTAVSVVNATRQQQPRALSSCMAPPDMRDFSRKDLRTMQGFLTAQRGRVLQHLIQSFCPAIYGHQVLKAGILLSLFGGVRKGSPSPDSLLVSPRGDIHVLMLGDPGVGKSQMLRAAAAVSPRSVYVSGGATSAAGLTVAIVKDPLTGDFAFEAGALVLSDMGTCCMDEFDKMQKEHDALLEAMEQQTVSVAKAGLLACLPARTSIIAAGNPAQGTYDLSKTVMENIKVSPALFSRFDLVFIVRDNPDEMTDNDVTSHVIAMHSGVSFQQRRRVSQSGSRESKGRSAVSEEKEERLPLKLRLQLSREEEESEPLSTQELKKYIAYARTYVHPRLSGEAKAILEEFYVRARGKADLMEGVPVTVRVLESAIRVAEARARMEMRETVTREDAEDAVEMMCECIFSRAGLGLGLGGSGGDDMGGTLGSGRGGGRGGGKSKSKEKQRFLKAIQSLSKKDSGKLYSQQDFSQLADDMHLRVPELDALIQELNEAGHILKKPGGQYQVLA